MVYFLIVKYYLIYWPDEDSVSAVPSVEVKEEVAVGSEYWFKNGRKISTWERWRRLVSCIVTLHIQCCFP